MKYTYHVVYNFNKLGDSGFGSITMYRDKKIETSADVKSIKAYIENVENMGHVVILNWLRLKSEEGVRK